MLVKGKKNKLQCHFNFKLIFLKLSFLFKMVCLTCAFGLHEIEEELESKPGWKKEVLYEEIKSFFQFHLKKQISIGTVFALCLFFVLEILSLIYGKGGSLFLVLASIITCVILDSSVDTYLKCCMKWKKKTN
jgi:hypothetical protein